MTPAGLPTPTGDRAQVVAADHSITAEEYAELTQIASELGLNQQQLNQIRAEYREHLDAIKRMRQLPGVAGDSA